ncbi:unnamed protein product [Hymenolepis diminuta]|uniref:Uncharacterized protein n=1 Tax=Hymenolepis diminuta TaxID=6216 RepID=A0A564XWC2_HYMDI|nr:unnamed protein product [Hymenolepis diminuta]
MTKIHVAKHTSLYPASIQGVIKYLKCDNLLLFIFSITPAFHHVPSCFKCLPHAKAPSRLTQTTTPSDVSYI